ncbi:MAG: hypothetical protein IPJ88_15005 [Myxococcales bacterium]|nr:MAG: hypothetical protein IPJ88_15005 [Myxococcales bacterium]
MTDRKAAPSPPPAPRAQHSVEIDEDEVTLKPPIAEKLSFALEQLSNKSKHKASLSEEVLANLRRLIQLASTDPRRALWWLFPVPGSYASYAPRSAAPPSSPFASPSSVLPTAVAYALLLRQVHAFADAIPTALAVIAQARKVDDKRREIAALHVLADAYSGLGLGFEAQKFSDCADLLQRKLTKVEAS